MQTESTEKNITKILDDLKSKMQKTKVSFQRSISNIRSSRASSSMVDQIQVSYYGSMTPLNQLASVTVPESRVLLINPYDKSSLTEIEKAILKSDIGITPQNDGNVIRLVMPELITERRQELVKQLKARLEEARVSIRNLRRDANEEIKKLKSTGISEDEIKSSQENVQDLTNSSIKECEVIYSRKEEGILTV